MYRRLSLILPLLAGLASCTLIDQRTFYPPTRPGAAELARPAPLDTPALTLRIGPAEPDWHQAVADLVQTTLARTPNASFEVVASIVRSGEDAAQAQTARDVAKAITAGGVLPSKVRLALRAEPNGAARDIRVFVR